MSGTVDRRIVATLWTLAWEEASRISCVVYRVDDRVELALESPSAVIMRRRCVLEPRMLARAAALRAALLRRGWREVPPDWTPGGDAPVR
jgi:hypothetical protein